MVFDSQDTDNIPGNGTFQERGSHTQRTFRAIAASRGTIDAIPDPRVSCLGDI